MALIIEQPRARRDLEWLIVAATVAVNLGTFLFHVMIARAVDPSTYGAIAAVMGLLVLFLVPASAFQVLVAKAVQSFRQEDGPSNQGQGLPLPMGRLLGDAVGGGIGVAILLVLLAPFIRDFLHLPSLQATLMIAAYVVPVAIGLVPKGVLVGEARYVPLTVALIAGNATSLGLGIVVIHGGHGLGGALGSLVGGELVTAAILLFSVRPHLATKNPSGPIIDLRWRNAGTPAVAFLGYWLLTNLDVILARHYLPAPASGRYGAAATAAQVALFVPGGVAALAFARFSRSREARVARLVLARGVLMVAVLGAVSAVGVSVWATEFVTGIFGGLYPQAGAVVGMLTVGGAIFGVIIVLLYFQMAANVRFPSRLTWGGVVLLVALTAVRHKGMDQIALNLLIAASAVGLSIVAFVLGGDRPVDDNVIEQADLALLDADLDLTIVVPYYNPGELLAANLQRLVEVLSHSESSFEVIAVSDGSTDGSERSIDAIDDPRVLRIVLPRNMGKGAALRIGLAKGRGKWLGFIDADGDLDPHLLEPFQVLTHLYDPEIILGSKRHPLSDVDYPRVRRIYSWTYYHLIHLLFSLDIKDTQTGIKLVRRDVLAAVLPRMVEKRFAFDLELFVVARRLGYKRFLEAPVRVKHQFKSTVSLRSVQRTLFETIAIFFRLRLLHWYDEPLPPLSSKDAFLPNTFLPRWSHVTSVPTTSKLDHH